MRLEDENNNESGEDKEIYRIIHSEPRDKFKKCKNLQVKEGLEIKPF